MAEGKETIARTLIRLVEERLPPVRRAVDAVAGGPSTSALGIGGPHMRDPGLADRGGDHAREAISPLRDCAQTNHAV